MLALAHQFDAIDLPWVGFDLDEIHHSFSDRYPDQVGLRGVGSHDSMDEGLLSVFQEVGRAPVTLVDVPAQYSQVLIGGMERHGFIEAVAAKGGRVTLGLFLADEEDTLAGMLKAAQIFGKRVDYLLVRNYALFASRRAERSKVTEVLTKSYGARIVSLPSLMEPTKRDILRVEMKQGPQTWEKIVCEHMLGDPFLEGDVAFFLAQWQQEFETAAEVLLPTEAVRQLREALAERQAEREAARRLARERADDFELSLEEVTG